MTQNRRTIKKASKAERAEYQRKLEQEDLEALKAQGREAKRVISQRRAAIDETCSLLKAEREAQGLSLADLAERTGMTKGFISRLENRVDPNPTLATLMRWADALGKRLVVSLEGPKRNRGS